MATTVSWVQPYNPLKLKSSFVRNAAQHLFYKKRSELLFDSQVWKNVESWIAQVAIKTTMQQSLKNGFEKGLSSGT